MNGKISWIIVAAALLGGCKSNTVEVDRVAPFSARGISTETRDSYILVSWLSNQEPDVAGYRVYASNALNGVYALIGETDGLVFADFDATNGETSYYALSAVDATGNESPPSTEVVYDTPRPEGTGVPLPNVLDDPTRAGYDFSTFTVGPYDDEFTDIYFEHTGGMSYLVARDDTEIQDMGYTGSLSEIGIAPAAGWSPTKDVRVIPGHTYVVETWDNHYAKVRVRSVFPTMVVFDWTYQTQTGNPRLKTIPDRARLQAGSGSVPR